MAESAIKESSDYITSLIYDSHFSGVFIQELKEKHGLALNDLAEFLQVDSSELVLVPVELYFLEYYINWLTQDSYYYAPEHCGFQARLFITEGTNSKYLSLDYEIDDLNYYTYFVKFGFCGCTEYSSQERRNRYLTREKCCAFLRKYDGEFPKCYFNGVMQ